MPYELDINKHTYIKLLLLIIIIGKPNGKKTCVRTNLLPMSLMRDTRLNYNIITLIDTADY